MSPLARSFAEAHAAEVTPCLRQMLEEPHPGSYFPIDGSTLLVKLDPSLASKQLQARIWTDADFADVDHRTWVETLAQLAAGGVVCLPGRDPAVAWYKERLFQRHRARLSRTCPGIEAIEPELQHLEDGMAPMTGRAPRRRSGARSSSTTRGTSSPHRTPPGAPATGWRWPSRCRSGPPRRCRISRRRSPWRGKRENDPSSNGSARNRG